MNYFPWNYSKPYHSVLRSQICQKNPKDARRHANVSRLKTICQQPCLHRKAVPAANGILWNRPMRRRWDYLLEWPHQYLGVRYTTSQGPSARTLGKHQSVVILAIFSRYSKNLFVGCVHSVPHQSVVWICTWTWPERTPAIRVQSIENSPYNRLGHGLKARKLRSKSQRTPKKKRGSSFSPKNRRSGW